MATTRPPGTGGDDGRDTTAQDGGGDPAARQRRIDSVGSVLMAIGDGIGLHAVLDPDFDLDGAIAAVDFLLGDAVARLAEDDGSPRAGSHGQEGLPVST